MHANHWRAAVATAGGRRAEKGYIGALLGIPTPPAPGAKSHASSNQPVRDRSAIPHPTTMVDVDVLQGMLKLSSSRSFSPRLMVALMRGNLKQRTALIEECRILPIDRADMIATINKRITLRRFANAAIEVG